MAENEKKRTCSFIMVMVTSHVTNAGPFLIDVISLTLLQNTIENEEEMAWTVKLCDECLNSIIHEHDERNLTEENKYKLEFL